MLHRTEKDVFTVRNQDYTVSAYVLALIQASALAGLWERKQRAVVRNSALRGQEGACLASRCAAVGA